MAGRYIVTAITLVSTAMLLVVRLRKRKLIIITKASTTTIHWKQRVRLHLVGAGPGDPELLTLAAVRALRETDLIVADTLVPESIIERFVRKDTKVLVANKVKGKAHEAQMELQQWTLEGLQKGLDVVRLKGGDPFLYGRGGEEVQFFASKGYQAEVIPGISSSMVGPLSIGVPVTTRNFADQFTVATLHGKRDSTPGVPSPYRPNRTVVFLMSVSRIDQLVQGLTEAGYPASLGVSVVERATLPNQRSMHTTIHQLMEDVVKFDLKSPSIIIVGGTAGNRAGLPQVIRWENGGVVFDSY